MLCNGAIFWSLSGAEPIAWYEDDFFAGKPAATGTFARKRQGVLFGEVAEEESNGLFRGGRCRSGSGAIPLICRRAFRFRFEEGESRILFLVESIPEAADCNAQVGPIAGAFMGGRPVGPLQASTWSLCG